MKLREYQRREREARRLEKLAPPPNVEDFVTQVYHRRPHGYSLHKEKKTGGRGYCELIETLGKKNRPYWEVACSPCGPVGRALTQAGARTLATQHLKASHPGSTLIHVAPIRSRQVDALP